MLFEASPGLLENVIAETCTMMELLSWLEKQNSCLAMNFTFLKLYLLINT